MLSNAALQHQVLLKKMGLLIALFSSSILAAVCPRWGQIHFWAQCEQTSLWGFDDRPAADHCYHPGVPLAKYLWVWTRWKDMDFLPRCQGQELCHRVLQHSHTRPNQVFFLQRSALLSHRFSSSSYMALSFSSHDLFTCFSTSLLHPSSLGWELVNLRFPQQRALCKE